MQTVKIADFIIGGGQPCFIIAEAGVNHNGDINLAYQMVDAAVQAGVDAIKFQIFKAELLTSTFAPKADYQNLSTDVNESQLEMLKRLELPQNAFVDLMSYCRKKGIEFLCSPFDEQSADLLDSWGVNAIKIPSGEITNLPFLSHVARKRKPMIVSTGMATLGEVELAVNTINQAGNPPLVLLHCVSNYPADPTDINLRAMATMEHAFGMPIGYSDHTLGIEVSLAAVALGACIIEKHFTLDCTMAGPDHKASSEPAELTAMVKSIRVVESALGNGRKEPSSSEASIADVARKSLVTACHIPAGIFLTKEMVSIKRPGDGLPPLILPYLLGLKTRKDIPPDAIIKLDMFE